jgi:hypothetical protein
MLNINKKIEKFIKIIERVDYLVLRVGQKLF